MPFGLGPRICLGMKFALLEIKLTLVKVLKNYNINSSSTTPKKMEIAEGFGIRTAKYGTSVVVTKREE